MPPEGGVDRGPRFADGRLHVPVAVELRQVGSSQ
jgi:hypothetical protein